MSPVHSPTHEMDGSVRILLVYNDYKIRGGEAASFENERDLLRQHGHDVVTYTLSNDATDRMHPLEIAGRMVFNPGSYRALRKLIQQTRPDVVHCHNFYILVSPSLYYAASAEGVPVVQTLHNYRLFCPAATFFRDGKVCEDCLKWPLPLPGVIHSCYRNDWRTSGAVAGMITTHRMLGTWRNRVTRYIALTKFTRDKYIEGGLPARKVALKPNFLRDDPGYSWNPDSDPPYALFVGRLSEEKGVRTLLDAWQFHHPGIGLKLAGDGPLSRELRARAESMDDVELCGPQGREGVYALMRGATMLLFPSIWYECLPYSLLEAFGIGLPTIVSRIGSIESMIRDGESGLLASPGDATDWSETIQRALADPEGQIRISREARSEFETRYAPDASLDILLAIYHEAIRENRVASTA